MQKLRIITVLGLCALLAGSCNTECKSVTVRNITILVDATDSVLVDKAQYELRKENFRELVQKKLGLQEHPDCFTLNYHFGYISTHSYYNPVSTQLSQTNWGRAKNKQILGWRGFYNAHEENLRSLDSLGNMENTSLFPTLMKAIGKTDGIILVVSDLIENNPAVNFYKDPPVTAEQMEKAYQKMSTYYLPDTVAKSDAREVLFIVMSEPKNSGVVHKARAFWKYALEEQMGLQVRFADGISTL